MVPFAPVSLLLLLAMLLFALGAYVALMVLLSHGQTATRNLARPLRRRARKARRSHLRVIRPTKPAMGGAADTLTARKLVVPERRR